MKGHVTLSAVISAAGTLLVIIGSIFAWTYSQFMAQSAHAAQTDVTVAGVVQKTTDVDNRLSRIEDKIDLLISKK